MSRSFLVEPENNEPQEVTIDTSCDSPVYVKVCCKPRSPQGLLTFWGSPYGYAYSATCAFDDEFGGVGMRNLMGF